MIVFQTSNAIPGSEIKTWSSRHNVWHVGMVDWPDWYGGEPRFLHSQKGGGVASTALAEFAEPGQPIYVVRVPRTAEEQQTRIARMRAQIGKPYNLLTANCETAVNLAVEDKAYSQTVGAVFLFLLIGAVVIGVIREGSSA